MSAGGSMSKSSSNNQFMNKVDNNSQSQSNNYSGFSSEDQQQVSPEQQAALTQLWREAQDLQTTQTGDIARYAAQGNQRQFGESQAAGDNQRWNTDQSNQAWNNQLQGGVYGGMNNAGQLGQSLGQGNVYGGMNNAQQLNRDLNQGNVYQGMNNAGQLSNSLQQSLAGPSNMQSINNMIMGGDGNNYADAMRGQYIKDANRAQGNMLQNMDARAAASGMSGGSRHGTGIGIGMEGINDSLQRNMAETGYQTFDKDLDRKLGIASQADQATLARQGMMQGMLGQQQRAMQGNQGLRADMLGQQQQGQQNTQGLLAGMLGQQQQGVQGAIGQTGGQQGFALSPYNTSGNFTDSSLQRSNEANRGGLSWLSGLIGGPTVLSSGSASGSGGGSSSSSSNELDNSFGYGSSKGKSMGGSGGAK